MREILEIVDPEDEGYVTYERFLQVAALKMKCLSSLGIYRRRLLTGYRSGCARRGPGGLQAFY